MVRRWNGSSWTEYSLKGWTGQGQIRSVTSSGGETWIGGGTFGPSGSSDYLARFDGTAFQKVDKPTEVNLDVISTGPAGTWVSQIAGGDGSAFRLHKRTGSTWTGYRYSGGTWHPAALPAGLAMYDITAMPGTSTIWGVAHKAGLSDPAVLKNS